MSELEQKREEVLKAIKPICEAFKIKDYDYIVSETGQMETLRICNTKIGCTSNSISAVIDELIGYIFVSIYCRNRYIGAYKTQTLNRVMEYWIKEAKP